MNLPPEFADEFRALLHAVAEGDVTDAQAARLNDLLRASDEAVAYYTAFMQQQADLARSFGSARPPAVLPPLAELSPRPGLRLFSPRLRFLATMAAVAAAVALMMTFVPKAAPPGEAVAAEPTDPSVALLSQASGAEWDGATLRAGAPLSPGRLRLHAGLAQVQFYSGATLLIEGPAELELLATDMVRFRQGKFRVKTPGPASRFTVETATPLAVDPGSDVGIDATRAEAPEVHVLHGSAHLPDLLRQGQAARWSAGKWGRMEATSQPFAALDELAARSRDERARRYQEWRQADHGLTRDPALLAHYAFDDPAVDPASPRNLAGAGASDGAVIGCSWVEGRWPGKHGLDFKRVGDRVRLDVPGEFASVSLVAWLRVDALPHRLNAVLMSDGFPVGALHWQINAEGAVILGVQSPNKKDGASYTSPPVFTAGRLGQWAQLAVVNDAAARQVTHYLDGKPVGRLPLKFETPLRIGPGEIGNWAPSGFSDARPIRNFVGRIDELLIFSRPLADADIARKYDQGRP